MNKIFHRVMIAVWCLSCLIVASSYTGNLKAHLTTPTVSAKIDSVQAIVDSGLPVEVYVNSRNIPRLLETSPDANIQKIWKDKLFQKKNVDIDVG